MNPKNPLTTATRIPSRAASRYQSIDFPQRGSNPRRCHEFTDLKVANSRPVANGGIDQTDEIPDEIPDDLAIVIPQALATCGRLFARLHTAV